MHEEAEFGVCAHWRYKGADRQGGNSYEEKIAWLRQVLDWQEELDGGAADVADKFSRAQERIYVFTPEGHVVNLAQGSTPLDFAYHIHTEVGHRCRGAKVNGRIVPLTYVLDTGEQVEILTGKECAPRRDWLQPALGYLKSSRARAKVQGWFRLQAREDNVAAGRALVEKIFRRMALTSLDYKSVAKRFGYQQVEDMYAAVGAGDISSSQIIAVSERFEEALNKQSEPELIARASKESTADSGIIVNGIGNLVCQIAGCCKPVPGDSIIGYVTVGRGVTVHRQDCTKMLQLEFNEPERVIEVTWGEGKTRSNYPVDIVIKAYDRTGLLRDITTMLANAKIDVLAVNTRSERSDHTADMRLTVEISSLSELGALLARMNRLPNVISAERTREGEH
jgi:GTP pyrophosphokinase